MSGEPGTEAQPLRVAVIGAGPAGFYAAEHLFRQAGLVAEVDLFDRLPTPYGLVRFGVAPDHQKIKTVTATFDKIAANPGFRFFGNVEVGQGTSRSTSCAQHYHQIVFATGAQTDRRMGIPGEDLGRQPPGHRVRGLVQRPPRLPRSPVRPRRQERVAVVGVGNVAVDVARILCRTPEELRATDIADDALEALSREPRPRGLPARPARPGPGRLHQSRGAGARRAARGRRPRAGRTRSSSTRSRRPRSSASADRATAKKVEILRELRAPRRRGRSRGPSCSASWSRPVELAAARAATSSACGWSGTSCSATGAGTPPGAAHRPVRGPGRGAGVPLRRLPGRAGARRALPRRVGRDPERARPRARPGAREPRSPGEYVAGWIKRGPIGVIGTNKPDAGGDGRWR